jgi:hypothetical protein
MGFLFEARLIAGAFAVCSPTARAHTTWQLRARLTSRVNPKRRVLRVTQRCANPFRRFEKKDEAPTVDRFLSRAKKHRSITSSGVNEEGPTNWPTLLFI